MKHAVTVIPLSPQEEDTLRLLGHGPCPVGLLRSEDIDQLGRLGLVGLHDGTVALTGFGQVRLAQIGELQLWAMIRAARTRRLQERAA